jgi:hypothetical protein
MTTEQKIVDSSFFAHAFPLVRNTGKCFVILPGGFFRVPESKEGEIIVDTPMEQFELPLVGLQAAAAASARMNIDWTERFMRPGVWSTSIEHAAPTNLMALKTLLNVMDISIHSATGFRGDLFVMTRDAFDRAAGERGPQEVAEKIGVSRLMVLDVIPGQPLPPMALLLHVPESPGHHVPAAGYTFIGPEWGTSDGKVTRYQHGFHVFAPDLGAFANLK